MTWNPKVLHLPCYSYEITLIIAKKNYDHNQANDGELFVSLLQ